MISPIHSFNYPALNVEVVVQHSDHPPFARVALVAGAMRENAGEVLVVVEDPAALDGFKTILSCSGGLLRHIQEGGRAETWPEEQFRYVNETPRPALEEVRMPEQEAPPRTIRRR